MHNFFNFEVCQTDILFGHLNLTELGPVNHSQLDLNIFYTIQNEIVGNDNFEEL